MPFFAATNFKHKPNEFTFFSHPPAVGYNHHILRAKSLITLIRNELSIAKKFNNIDSQ